MVNCRVKVNGKDAVNMNFIQIDANIVNSSSYFLILITVNKISLVKKLTV